MSALPNFPFVSIDSTRVAVDAPVSTDLMTDMAVDLNFLAAGLALAGGKSLAVFTTPGAGTWTVPAGVTSAIVEAVGGGASGAGGSTNPGGGGGSGAWQTFSLTGLVAGTVVNIQVGTGGPLTSPGTNGTDGTPSWVVNSSFYADYGRAGLANGTPGVGGSAQISSTLFGMSGESGGSPSGGTGGTGSLPSWLRAVPASAFNRPVGAVTPATQAGSGALYGGGGGGSSTVGTQDGGVGANGIILIRY